MIVGDCRIQPGWLAPLRLPRVKLGSRRVNSGTRTRADTLTWTITAPRVERGNPDLECRIRAATRWEGRIVKQAYDTITFWGAVDPVATGPDLVVESPTVSNATLTPGQAFTMSVTVRNTGGAMAESDRASLRFYRSDFRRIEPDNTPASGTLELAALASGAAVPVSHSLTAPPEAGSYYFGACVRAPAESDTGNNCSDGVRVTVNVMPGGGFTDHPVVAGRTVVKAVHFTELRRAIDALRVGHGLGRHDWDDPDLRSGVTPIRAAHLAELRSALDDVYDAARRSRPRYARGASPGAAVRAVHINELRRAVLALGDDYVGSVQDVLAGPPHFELRLAPWNDYVAGSVVSRTGVINETLDFDAFKIMAGCDDGGCATAGFRNGVLRIRIRGDFVLEGFLYLWDRFQFQDAGRDFVLSYKYDNSSWDAFVVSVSAPGRTGNYTLEVSYGPDS